jgi:integrase
MIATVNASLRILRRILRLAQEWGELENVPRVKTLPGENHRERVITREEEARFLASARLLLAELAIVFVDTGLRSQDCYRLLWESITWDQRA